VFKTHTGKCASFADLEEPGKRQSSLPAEQKEKFHKKEKKKSGGTRRLGKVHAIDLIGGRRGRPPPWKDHCPVGQLKKYIKKQGANCHPTKKKGWGPEPTEAGIWVHEQKPILKRQSRTTPDL